MQELCEEIAGRRGGICPAAVFEQGLKARPWYAVRVRSNFERQSSNYLSGRGLEIYVPEYTVKRYGRATSSPRPLLPGYVLCRLDVANRLPVLSAPGVVGIVGCGRIPIPIEEPEIANLRLVAQSGAGIKPWPFLKPGDAVIVESGPLAGLRGMLLETRSSFRVVVSVQLLQRSISAELEWDCVRPVPKGKDLGPSSYNVRQISGESSLTNVSITTAKTAGLLPAL